MTDGRSMKGYLPYYGAYSNKVPLVEGNDIKPNISAGEWRDYIKFYINIYYFENVIFGSREEDIKEINLSDIEKILYISKTAHGGAGPVPLLTNRDIKLLSGQIYEVKVYTNGGCDYIYVNCNPNISSREFDFFFKSMKHYKWPSIQSIIHPDCRFKVIERSVGNSESIQNNMKFIQSEVEFLSEIIDSLKKINQQSLLVKYFEEYKQKYVLLNELSNALLTFLSSEEEQNYTLLHQDLIKIFGDVPEIKNLQFDIEKQDNKWDIIKPCFNILREYYTDVHKKISLKMLDECDIVLGILPWD